MIIRAVTATPSVARPMCLRRNLGNLILLSYIVNMCFIPAEEIRKRPKSNSPVKRDLVL